MLMPLTILTIICKSLLALIVGVGAVVFIFAAAMALAFFLYNFGKIIEYFSEWIGKHFTANTWNRIVRFLQTIVFVIFVLILIGILVIGGCFVGCTFLKEVFHWNLFPGHFGF